MPFQYVYEKTFNTMTNLNFSKILLMDYNARKHLQNCHQR